eukprot:1139962-Pelagomonas_calceolata.AAC.2
MSSKWVAVQEAWMQKLKGITCVSQPEGCAASKRAVGMTSLAKCAFVRARKQKGPLSPEWFDEQCRLKRKMFIEAVKHGEAKQACQFNHATKCCHKRQ